MINYIEDKDDGCRILVKIPDNNRFSFRYLYSNGVHFKVTPYSVLVYDYDKTYTPIVIRGETVTVISIPLNLEHIDDINCPYAIAATSGYLVNEWNSSYKAVAFVKHINQRRFARPFSYVNGYFACANLKTVYGRYKTEIIGIRVCRQKWDNDETFVVVPVNTQEAMLFDAFLCILVEVFETNNVDDALAIVIDVIYPLVF